MNTISDVALRHRVIAGVVLGGGILAFSWVSAPAQPATRRVPSAAEELPSEDAALLVDDITRQTETLRMQMDRRLGLPDAARDPFSFVTYPPVESDVPSHASTARLDVAVESRSPDGFVSWPTLAAVMAHPGSGSLAMTAVLGWDAGIEFVAAGDTFKEFVVVSMSSVSITLRHTPTKTLRTLTLR